MLISGKRPELYSFLSPLKVTLLLSLLTFHEMLIEQTECQSVFHSRKCIDFRQNLPGFRADLSEELVSYVDRLFCLEKRANLCQRRTDQ